MDEKEITKAMTDVKDKIVDATLPASRETDIIYENTHQFLVFKINEEEYALDVLSVQEIVGYTYLTPVPGATIYMKGLINLRGNILHVIDLAERFGLSRQIKEGEGVIIVVSLGARKFGVIADMVSDVVNVNQNNITENPITEKNGAVQASHMIKTDDKIIMVLPVDKIIGE